MRNESEDLKQEAKQLAEEAVKKTLKEAFKSVGQAILGAISAVLPYIIIGLLIALVIIACIDWNDVGITASAEGMNNVNINSGISVNKTNLTRDEFIKCVEDYSNDEDYYNRFAQYAGKIYDICTEKKVSPVLCVAQASNESNFGKNVPPNSKWNYWGIGVYNNSSEGKEFNSIDEAITDYCNIILSYQKDGSIAYTKAQEYAKYNNKITGNMNSIYDILCAYAFLGDVHSDRIWDGVNAKTYLTDYISFPCSHELSENTTLEEQAAYAVDYVENHIIRDAKKIFGESILITSSINIENIELYNSDGTVNEEKVQELEYALEKDHNILIPSGKGLNNAWRNIPQKDTNNATRRAVTGEFHGFSGKVVKEQPKGYNGLSTYQCTWWANGRASEYLSKYGTVYKKYPSNKMDGGGYYKENKNNGWFNYGSEPKPNSLLSTKSGSAGHVLYIEAVDYVNKVYYASEAGSGYQWAGIQKYKFGKHVCTGDYGFIYLAEPIKK